MIFKEPKIIVALDFANEKRVWNLVDQLSPQLCRLKVGKELFTASGPSLVKQLIHRGFSVFLDLKFHDIPNTVAKACKVAADLGVWMINVHASGGFAMMQAAKEALISYDTLLIGVTVLTSFEEKTLQEISIETTCQQHVLRLAMLTKQASLDGVVCSPQETALLREIHGESFCLVTPGVRCQEDKLNDQKRTVTPEMAIVNGADYLVIGRPITQSPSPIEKLTQINLAISAI